MAIDLSPEDQAQLMAEGLNIPSSSYGGRVGDAIVAMALVAGYRRMTFSDQRSILYVISEKMQFGATNPAFVQGCQAALALMIANPAWIPPSLSNAELTDDIKFWRGTSAVLRWLGFSGGAYVSAKSKAILGEIKDNLLKADPGKPIGLSAVTGPVRSSLKPNVLSGGLVFGEGAKIIADSSIHDLEQEATRRGLLGTMGKVDANRYGVHP